MIDMHCHSTCSDGKFTPIELLKLAEQEKLDYFSITDHDNVLAYEELSKIDVKKYFSGKIIPGVELRFLHKGNQLEVLCYNYEYEKIKGNYWVSKDYFHHFKKALLKNCLEKAKQVGFVYDEISYDEQVKPERAFFNELLNHKENLPIIEKYKLKHAGDFYRKLIVDPSSPMFFDATPFSPNFEQITNFIHSCGGIAVLAHPFGVYNLENPKETINELIATGKLDGLECMHMDISSEQTEYLINLCKKHNLVSTGGSDYHGYPGQVFARANFAKSTIPTEILNSFLQKIK